MSSLSQGDGDVSLQIAIDGPAASGKGTLAKTLAMALGYDYLDTGTLYRAVAKLAADANLVHPDGSFTETDIVEIARNLTLPLGNSDGLRTSEIAQIASKIASNIAVREALIDKQRQFAKTPPNGKGAVLDGRDIGTVILPDADLKLYIDADVEVRAKRRFLELSAKDETISQAQILADLIERDTRDKTRKTAPLIPAPDAQIIDTSEMSAQEVLEIAVNLVKRL